MADILDLSLHRVEDRSLMRNHYARNLRDLDYMPGELAARRRREREESGSDLGTDIRQRLLALRNGDEYVARVSVKDDDDEEIGPEDDVGKSPLALRKNPGKGLGTPEEMRDRLAIIESEGCEGLGELLKALRVGMHELRSWKLRQIIKKGDLSGMSAEEAWGDIMCIAEQHPATYPPQVLPRLREILQRARENWTKARSSATTKSKGAAIKSEPATMESKNKGEPAQQKAANRKIPEELKIGLAVLLDDRRLRLQPLLEILYMNASDIRSWGDRNPDKMREAPTSKEKALLAVIRVVGKTPSLIEKSQKATFMAEIQGVRSQIARLFGRAA